MTRLRSHRQASPAQRKTRGSNSLAKENETWSEENRS
jgi:hypothetical protein